LLHHFYKNPKRKLSSIFCFHTIVFSCMALITSRDVNKNLKRTLSSIFYFHMIVFNYMVLITFGGEAFICGMPSLEVDSCDGSSYLYKGKLEFWNSLCTSGKAQWRGLSHFVEGQSPTGSKFHAFHCRHSPHTTEF
jgi:hypothetical protein